MGAKQDRQIYQMTLKELLKIILTATLRAQFRHLKLLFSILICSNANADGAPVMLDLRAEPTSFCDRIGNLILSENCRMISIGDLQIRFMPITADLGLLSIEAREDVDFLAISTGRMFFFGRATGGVDNKSSNGDISIRNIFCLEVAGGLSGYAWDGSTYSSSQEAADACPIGLEVEE